ncbi:unnamed protein product [Rotaria sp. Silwood1]|nr:unnamed protein product [Rotaria sp. Silwood1]CAF4822214.1 unnamed protein product [Rotaria sp. Silwood1]
MDLPTIMYRYNSMTLLMPQRIFYWIITEYNITLTFERQTVPSPITSFMNKMYLPVISRYSSFIIGSVLALNLMNAKNSNVIYYGKMKKYLYFTLIWLYMLILVTPAEPTAVNHVLLAIMISIGRQLFSISQAFILFSALCPSTHPYHSSWIRSFLSLPIWTSIAK